MLKINELRVDNWVYNSYTKQNTQVYPMMIPQLHRLEKENGSLKDCNIEPIPLTEEILLKCGFDKFLKGIKCSDVYDTYRLGFFQIENHFGIYVFHGVEIKHLHQLQNLYFALTNQELKIAL